MAVGKIPPYPPHVPKSSIPPSPTKDQNQKDKDVWKKVMVGFLAKVLSEMLKTCEEIRKNGKDYRQEIK